LVFLIALSIFLATILAAVALYWWVETRRESLPRRFKDMVDEESGAPIAGVFGTTRKRLNALRERFSAKPPAATELVERLSGKELKGARLRLNEAGIRGAGAYSTYLAVQWGSPIVFVLFAFAYAKRAGLSNPSIVLLLLMAVIAGYILPDLWLRRSIRKRQEEITDSLPDGLDLLVVCVEAGLGLNASFLKITEEFKLASPALSEEFDIVNREMVAGKPRQEALRALSERTGVEDVKSLVAMLVQTEKLGTSLAQSLRIHSDSLRTRRRQGAEEAAAKTTIKLVFPLVFLMFPALFIVILGPGVIQVLKILVPVVPK